MRKKLIDSKLLSVLLLSTVLFLLPFMSVVSSTLPRSMTSIDHKFYVSLTEIRLNSSNHTVEISMRIFPDDLDLALEDIYGSDPQIMTELEHTDADTWITEYISSSFIIQLNGKKIDCKYIGKETESDAVWCYFEAIFKGNPKDVLVTQSILTEVFSEQVNIVQLYYEEFNKGLMLDRLNPSGKIEITENKRSRR